LARGPELPRQPLRLRAGLDPEPSTSEVRIEARRGPGVILHAIVPTLPRRLAAPTARRCPARLKQVTTAERVRVGRELIAAVGDLAMIS